VTIPEAVAGPSERTPVDTSGLTANPSRAERDATLRIAHGLAFGMMSEALHRSDGDAVTAAVEELVDACQAYVDARPTTVDGSRARLSMRSPREWRNW
jgi:hypothetical protein